MMLNAGRNDGVGDREGGEEGGGGVNFRRRNVKTRHLWHFVLKAP